MNPLIVTINSKGNVLLLPAVSHDMACRGPCDVVHGWEAPHILRAWSRIRFLAIRHRCRPSHRLGRLDTLIP